MEADTIDSPFIMKRGVSAGCEINIRSNKEKYRQGMKIRFHGRKNGFSCYLQNGDAASDDHVVADVFHYAGRFARHQREQHRSLVQVPEQEKLAARRGRASHVAEQIGGRVPEDPLEAQHHLT